MFKSQNGNTVRDRRRVHINKKLYAEIMTHVLYNTLSTHCKCIGTPQKLLFSQSWDFFFFYILCVSPRFDLDLWYLMSDLTGVKIGEIWRNKFGGYLRLLILLHKVARGLKPIPADTGWETGNPWTNCPWQAATHTCTLKLPINPTCVSLDCGREPEYLEGSHADISSWKMTVLTTPLMGDNEQQMFKRKYLPQLI